MSSDSMPRDGAEQLTAPTASQHSPQSIPIFARLPAEIWTEIIRLFCDHCRDPTYNRPSQDFDQLSHDKAALSALSKTCRWLRDAVQPVLHHHFPFFVSYKLNINPTKRLYLFVRTLIERPDLARQVRALRAPIVEHMLHDRPIPMFDFILDDDSGFELLLQATKRLGLSLPRGWDPESLSQLAFSATGERELEGIAGWRAGDRWERFNENIDCQESGFLVQLAVCFCQDVQSIDLSPLPRLRDDALGYTLQGLAERNCTSRVERLRIQGDIRLRQRTLAIEDPVTRFDLRQLAALAKAMPKLRTLEVHFGFLEDRWTELRYHHRWSNTPAVTQVEGICDLDLSSLTRLQLVFCSLTEGRLSAILSKCANLTDFTYISMPTDFIDALALQKYKASVHPDKVSRILNTRCSNLQKTLQRLTLEHLQFLDYTYPVFTFPPKGRRPLREYRGVYSPLDNLTALKEVCLGANGLFITPAEQPILLQNSTPPALPRPLAQILPPNVGSLDIIMAGQWKKRTAAALITLFEDIQTGTASFRDLKDVRVWWGMPHCPFDPDAMEANSSYPEWWLTTDDKRESRCEWDTRVEEMAAAVGIRFGVSPRTLPPLIQRLQDFIPEVLIVD